MRNLVYECNMMLRQINNSSAFLPFTNSTGVSSRQSVTRHLEHFNLISSVIDLLAETYPAICSDIFLLKEAILKWNNQLTETLLKHNMEIMKVKEEAVHYIREDILIVIEEIGAYLKNAKNSMKDPQIVAYYEKYQKSIKKLRWEKQQRNGLFHSSEAQTEESCLRQKSSEGDANSTQMNETLMKLLLEERRNNALRAQIEEAAAKMAEMRGRNAQMLAKIEWAEQRMRQIQYREQDYVKQIGKLNEEISQIKSQECVNDQQTPKSIISKFRSSHSLRQEVADMLEQAQNCITLKAEHQKDQEQNKQFESNLRQFHTKNKRRRGEIDANDELRMLLVQAITLEDYLFTQSE